MVKVSLGLIGLEKLFGNDLTALAQFVRSAEDKGVDMVSCTDHVIMSENLDKYPYGPFPMPMDWPWYEPIVLLSAIASTTRRILLASGIVIAPLRPAVLLAKQLATLDVLSGGRLRIGLGVGWQKEEYDASGVEWEGRFGYLMEQVAVCRQLWGQAPASFHGKHVNFDRLHSVPFPVLRANMPSTSDLRLPIATSSASRNTAMDGSPWSRIPGASPRRYHGCAPPSFAAHARQANSTCESCHRCAWIRTAGPISRPRSRACQNTLRQEPPRSRFTRSVSAVRSPISITRSNGW
jgi:hypothetical protein